MSGNKIMPLYFEKWRDVDIDSPLELKIAEEIIKQKEQSAKLEPLKLEAFQLNHHKAEDVIEIIKGSNTSPSGGGAALSILSPNGTVSVDKRNNMIFVQDIPSRLEEVRKLLKRIDITTRQVLIESKIVIADSKWGKEIGAKIGLGAQGTSGRYSMGIGGNSIINIYTLPRQIMS